jgi:hypothetical protein
VVTRDPPNIRNLMTRHAVVTRDPPNIRNLRKRHAVATRGPPNIRNLRTRHAVVTRDALHCNNLLSMCLSFPGPLYSSGAPTFPEQISNRYRTHDTAL